VVQNGPNNPAFKRSVKVEDPATGYPPSISDVSLIWMVGQAASAIEPWGSLPKKRDRQLRAFITAEPLFASALGVVASRNMAFSWSIKGPPRVAERYKRVLNNSDDGYGWRSLLSKTSVDLYTQDYGAFWELVRDGDSPDSPVVAINHLDAARCWHTGNREYPVLYLDRKNRYHQLKWYQVVTLREMPAPVETNYPSPFGLQYCALTRILAICEIIRNINVYHEEKTGGRHARAIHLVKGLTNTQIQDALASYEQANNQRGFLRYVVPLIVASVDPKADIGHDTLELASMPDNFEYTEWFKTYIGILAMGFLEDYQTFAPLPGGNLGTSTQSQVLHLKARGKGPALFMKLISEALNFEVLPEGVEFFWDEQDYEEDKAKAEARQLRAQTRAAQIASQELTVEAARQIAVDEGDIPQEIFERFLQSDVTEEVTVGDEQNRPAQNKPQAPPRPAAQPQVPAEQPLPTEPTEGAKSSRLKAWWLEHDDITT